MAVTFTTNIGLAKPAESELALEWARNTKLAEDNNIIVVAQTTFPVITVTPTFLGPTTNPSVGAGSIIMEYQQIGKIIFGTFIAVFTDPGVAPGTGTGSYLISLPALADVTFHTVGTAVTDAPGTASCIGEGAIEDASAFVTSGTVAYDIVHIGGVAYLRPITETYAGKTVRWFGPSLPFVFATGDKISGNFIYKAA